MQNYSDLMMKDWSGNDLTGNELWELIKRIMEMERNNHWVLARAERLIQEKPLNNKSNIATLNHDVLYCRDSEAEIEKELSTQCQNEDDERDEAGMEEKTDDMPERIKQLNRVSKIAAYYGMSMDKLLDCVYRIHREVEIKRLSSHWGVNPNIAAEIYQLRMDEAETYSNEESTTNGIKEEIEEFERLRPRMAERLRSGEIEALPEKVVYYLKTGQRLSAAWLMYENETLVNDYMKLVERMHYLEKALKEERAKDL